MTNAVEHEIEQVEREYWDSMMSKDPEVATRLTAERSLITGAQGVGEVTSAAIGEMVQSDSWTLKRYTFSDVQVLTPAPDTAIIAYHVSEELEVGGESLTLEANDATVWMRHGDGWVSVLHTESVAGDPYGRDRTGK